MPSRETENLKSLYLSWVAAFAANPNMPVDERAGHDRALG